MNTPRLKRRLVALLSGLILIAVAGVLMYAAVAPPTLLRVGAGYSSKIVCSATFLSGRNPQAVRETDVEAPSDRALQVFSESTDRSAGVVHTAFLRFIAPMNSVFRPGLGCAAMPDGNLARARDKSTPPAPGPSHNTAHWPEGEGVDLSGHKDLAAVLNDDAPAGPGMRGIVVVKHGRIVAERYAPGFAARMPLLGWSMTKSVTAALVGTVIEAGKLRLDEYHLLPQWAGDGRAKITVAELMWMSSGLRFNEDYGDVSDVTRMPYPEPDMAAFVASEPLAAPPGSAFNYSSGTAVILSRVWQTGIGDKTAALARPRKALFGPLGMDSAVLQTDEESKFVGSSYLYATPWDWARFGHFLLQDGEWNARHVLSRAFVEMMLTPSSADPVYTNGMLWTGGAAPTERAGGDRADGLPADTVWLNGHDGQTVTVIPSAKLVVVRMGLTPGRLGFRSQRLVAALGHS